MIDNNTTQYTTVKTTRDKSPERVFYNTKKPRPTTPILIPAKNKTQKNRSLSVQQKYCLWLFLAPLVATKF